jgi:hypothetical protein
MIIHVYIIPFSEISLGDSRPKTLLLLECHVRYDLVHSADNSGKFNFISQAGALTTARAVMRNIDIAAIFQKVTYQTVLGLSRLAMT